MQDHNGRRYHPAAPLPLQYWAQIQYGGHGLLYRRRRPDQKVGARVRHRGGAVSAVREQGVAASDPGWEARFFDQDFVQEVEGCF